MANYFNLVLDTTPPSLTISAPDDIASLTMTTIFIQSNEPIGSVVECYIESPSGVIEEHTPIVAGCEAQVDIFFDSEFIGNTTFYIRVRDNVLNPSSLVSTTLNVVDAQALDILFTDKPSDLSVTQACQAIALEQSIQGITIVDERSSDATETSNSRQVSSNREVRNINVK